MRRFVAFEALIILTFAVPQRFLLRMGIRSRGRFGSYPSTFADTRSRRLILGGIALAHGYDRAAVMINVTS